MTFSGVLSCNLTDVNAGKRGGNLEDVSDSGCYDMAWAPVALGGCEECRHGLSTSETICSLSGFYLNYNPQTTSILLVVVCTGQQSPLFIFHVVDIPSLHPVQTHTHSQLKPQLSSHSKK